MELANNIAGNSHEVVSCDDNIAFLASHPLADYFRGSGEKPHGETLVAIYKHNAIKDGLFEDAEHKPIPFKGASYYKSPEDDPLSRTLKQSSVQNLKRMACPGDAGEAMLATYAKSIGADRHWERVEPHQYGVDLTVKPISDEAKYVIGLQPKMTSKAPYTKNTGWRKEEEKMRKNIDKLQKHNRIVRNADQVDFCAVANAEISPEERKKLEDQNIGYFYLHAYQID